MCFFLNDTATTEIYTYSHTLSLHDALPISAAAHPPIESRSRAAAISDAVAVHQRREAAMESSGSRAVHIARGTLRHEGSERQSRLPVIDAPRRRTRQRVSAHAIAKNKRTDRKSTRRNSSH